MQCQNTISSLEFGVKVKMLGKNIKNKTSWTTLKIKYGQISSSKSKFYPPTLFKIFLNIFMITILTYFNQTAHAKLQGLIHFIRLQNIFSLAKISPKTFFNI